VSKAFASRYAAAKTAAARNGASGWKMNETSRHKSTDGLASCVREAELSEQHASVGMYKGSGPGAEPGALVQGGLAKL
jgi:hypothetical protein